MQADIDTNPANKDGNTPLHVACAEGALEVVEVRLLGHQALSY
jgi:ankyrin repeat protein